MADLTVKAKIYGTAGWPVYWVVTPEAVNEHVEPQRGGYGTRNEYRRGQRVPVHCADTDLAVDDRLGAVDQQA